MKVIHVTFSTSGGAGAAASRLHRALRAVGCDSRLATAGSNRRDETEIALPLPALRWRARLDRSPLLRYRHREIFAWWSNNRLPSQITQAVCAATPDLVHLHWVGDGMLRPRALGEFDCPVVWTLHDMWPFTGGCHYAADCARFTAACGTCPQLGSTDPFDLSQRNLAAKIAAWGALPLMVVCPSRWMADCARRSRVFARHRIVALPNAVPLDQFLPRNRSAARARLGIHRDDVVLVAGSAGGSSDKRKGVSLLLDSAGDLKRNFQNRHVRIILFGPGSTESRISDEVIIRSMGTIKTDSELSWLFAAADIVVVPSLQDNLPNVAVEALACGTPVVGFKSGGLPEIVGLPACGSIAQEFSASALAVAIADCVSFRLKHPEAEQACRRFAEEMFAPASVATRHLALYTELLDLKHATSAANLSG